MPVSVDIETNYAARLERGQSLQVGARITTTEAFAGVSKAVLRVHAPFGWRLLQVCQISPTLKTLCFTPADSEGNSFVGLDHQLMRDSEGLILDLEFEPGCRYEPHLCVLCKSGETKVPGSLRVELPCQIVDLKPADALKSGSTALRLTGGFQRCIQSVDRFKFADTVARSWLADSVVPTNTTLVIVDVQTAYRSELRDLIMPALEREIALAKRHGWPIVLVEMKGMRATDFRLLRLLQDPAVRCLRVEKNSTSGADKILAACGEKGFGQENFRLGGLYSNSCIQDNVVDLSTQRPCSQIYVVEKACQKSFDDPFTVQLFPRLANVTLLG